MNLKRLIIVGILLVAAGLTSCADKKTKSTDEASSEAIKAAIAPDRKLYDELIAINPPGGKQLPTPAKNRANWQS